MGCAEDNSNEVVARDVTDQMNDDGKENAINPEDNNRYWQVYYAQQMVSCMCKA